MSKEKSDFYCNLIFVVLKFVYNQKKGGREMEEKMSILLEQMKKMEEKIDCIQEEINGIHEEMNGIQEEINGIHEEMNGIHEEMNGVHEEMNGIHDEIREIKGRQLLFEHEYGTKIDAIFDAVTLELDKNLEKSQKIRVLEGRMDRIEATSFNYEKRISRLELNQ